MKQEKRLRKKEEDEGAFFDQKKPPSSRKNMLFQHDISFDKVQVTKDRKTPDAEVFPVQTCPMCGRRMHAHGWRTRFIVDIERKTTLIWVRRVYCPGCRKTGTILPKFVHALKLFSLELPAVIHSLDGNCLVAGLYELLVKLHVASKPCGLRLGLQIAHELVILMVNRSQGNGMKDVEVAKALGISQQTVHNTKEKFLESQTGAEEAVQMKKRETPPVQPKVTGEVEAKIIALACTEPPEGRARWTLRLLSEKSVELEIIDSISHMQVGRILKKRT